MSETDGTDQTLQAARRRTRAGMIAAMALVLSFAAGATDAFAFLQLGGVFTANMTGNFVLAGLTSRPDFAEVLLGASVAVLLFSVGTFLAFRFTRPVATTDRPTPEAPQRRLVLVLGGAVVAQSCVLLGWIVSSDHRTMPVVCVLIALSTLAMAGQTAVARRIERSGVTTTFVTGTLTSLMQSLADGIHDHHLIRIGAIVLLVAGALCGSLLTGVDPVFGAALPLVPSIVGLVLLRLAPSASAH
ncbi:MULTISPECIES: YoaK family protein [unclassified Plantibacter]|uniref:YoaK family protein n=1 Tax=unclassified Plantibacter TaxID=2624265 RepID=UPI0006FBF2C4|nr:MULTISPECIES: YoaK family protein [unclassified Plantibacter]KQQ52776.1 hypothetical protein ASF68_10895 [Plantibacter sp. Leaf314]